METLWWIANDSVLLLASIIIDNVCADCVIGGCCIHCLQKKRCKKANNNEEISVHRRSTVTARKTALVFASIRNEGGGAHRCIQHFTLFATRKAIAPSLHHMQINTNAVIALSRKGNKGPASQIGCFGWSHEKRMNVNECSVAFAPIDLCLHWRCTLNKHTPSLHKVVKQTTTIAIAAYRLQVECFAYFGIVCLAKPAEATTKTTEHTLYVNRMKIAYGHSTICEHEMRRRSFGFILFHLLASVVVVCVVFCSFHFICFICLPFCFVCIFAGFRLCIAFVSNMIIISHFCT